MSTRLIEPSTPRLVLRQWRDADRMPFATLNGDPSVMEHFPALITPAQSEEFVDRCIESVRWLRRWAVEVRANGEFIGFVGLAAATWEATFTPCIEIGWRLARSAWGHGYATEAANVVLAAAFGVIGLDDVVSFTTTGNLRSQQVMQRLGMRHQPCDDFEHPRVSDGPLRRHALYRISRADWERDIRSSAPPCDRQDCRQGL